MGDKRIKVHEKEIYDFVRENKKGRTWTEIKKKFIDRITEKQINIKLKKMLHENHTLMKIKRFYMPNYFYTPPLNSYAQKIEDNYTFIGFSRSKLEKMDYIINKALFLYLEHLNNNHKELSDLMEVDFESFKELMDSKSWKERHNFYIDLDERNVLKYYFKEGFKYTEFLVKEDLK